MDITGSDDFFEAVSPDGELYRVPRSQARLFAALAALVVAAQLTRGPPAKCLQVDMRTRSSS
jgi:hypothetical protein